MSLLSTPLPNGRSMPLTSLFPDLLSQPVGGYIENIFRGLNATTWTKLNINCDGYFNMWNLIRFVFTFEEQCYVLLSITLKIAVFRHFGTDPDPRSIPLTNGSGCWSCPFRQWPSKWPKFFCLLLLEGTVHLHHSSQTKSRKEVKKQFSYNLCLIMGGFGSGSVPLTNGSKSRSPKTLRIHRLRIRNTAEQNDTVEVPNSQINIWLASCSVPACDTGGRGSIPGRNMSLGVRDGAEAESLKGSPRMREGLIFRKISVPLLIQIYR